MFVFIDGHSFDTVVGTEQLVTLLKYDLDEFVVAVFILCYENLLFVGIVRTSADADRAYIGGCRGLVRINSADGSFEGQGKFKT